MVGEINPIIIKKSIDTHGYITFDGENGPWLDRVYADGDSIRRLLHEKAYDSEIGGKTFHPIVEKGIPQDRMDNRLLGLIRESAELSAVINGDKLNRRPIIEDF